MTTSLILSEDFTAVWSLKEYLKAELQTGTNPIQIYHGWPEANKQLKLPTISLDQSGECTIISNAPRFIEQIAITGDLVNVRARYAIGRIELNIVVDIWEESKSRLGNAFQRFKNAINKSQGESIDNPKGLILELQGYYDTLARYDIVRYNQIRGEAEAQRGESRLQVILSCHFDEIKEVIMPKIVESQIVPDISETT